MTAITPRRRAAGAGMPPVPCRTRDGHTGPPGPLALLRIPYARDAMRKPALTPHERARSMRLMSDAPANDPSRLQHAVSRS